MGECVKSLVYGVGVNDSEEICVRNKRVGGKKKIIWSCPFYQQWRSMLRRCYDKSLHEKYPSYAVCKVSDEWLLFSTFKEWMRGQDWNGKHLDKDILIPGNKIYAPEFCLFVSQSLNNFLTDRSASRGDWPLGVCFNRQMGKFQANCRNPFTGKKEYLGLYVDAYSAHDAWRIRKRELACQYADSEADPRIAKALRDRF